MKVGKYEVVLLDRKEEWVKYLVLGKCQYRIQHNGKRFIRDTEYHRLAHASSRTLNEIEQLIEVGVL